MVLGKRAAFNWGGFPEDETARTLIHNAHTQTHLLGDQLCSLRRFQVPAGTLRTRPRTYVHTYIHPFICAHKTYLPHTSAHWGTVTSSETASVPARSAAGTHKPCGHTEQQKTTDMTFGHKHNPMSSCKRVTATVHQMNTQT